MFYEIHVINKCKLFLLYVAFRCAAFEQGLCLAFFPFRFHIVTFNKKGSPKQQSLIERSLAVKYVGAIPSAIRTESSSWSCSILYKKILDSPFRSTKMSCFNSDSHQFHDFFLILCGISSSVSPFWLSFFLRCQSPMGSYSDTWNVIIYCQLVGRGLSLSSIFIRIIDLIQKFDAFLTASISAQDFLLTFLPVFIRMNGFSQHICFLSLSTFKSCKA